MSDEKITPGLKERLERMRGDETVSVIVVTLEIQLPDTPRRRKSARILRIRIAPLLRLLEERRIRYDFVIPCTDAYAVGLIFAQLTKDEALAIAEQPLVDTIGLGALLPEASA